MMWFLPDWLLVPLETPGTAGLFPPHVDIRARGNISAAKESLEV